MFVFGILAIFFKVFKKLFQNVFYMFFWYSLLLKTGNSGRGAIKQLILLNIVNLGRGLLFILVQRKVRKGIADCT